MKTFISILLFLFSLVTIAQSSSNIPNGFNQPSSIPTSPIGTVPVYNSFNTPTGTINNYPVPNTPNMNSQVPMALPSQTPSSPTPTPTATPLSNGTFNSFSTPVPLPTVTPTR